MTGKEVLTTRIGTTGKVELRDGSNRRGSIPNYGGVNPSGDGFSWAIASGRSGFSKTESMAINATAAALRQAERNRITSIVRTELDMPDFMPTDLDYSVADGFTIDGEPWRQWLDAMTMD